MKTSARRIDPVAAQPQMRRLSPDEAREWAARRSAEHDPMCGLEGFFCPDCETHDSAFECQHAGCGANALLGCPVDCAECGGVGFIVFVEE